MKEQGGTGNLLLCEVRCLWLCCNLLSSQQKVLSELWKLLLPRWLKSIWSLSSLSQEINVCRNCSCGCALSIPLPCCPGCSWGVWWKPALERCLCSVCTFLVGVGRGESWGPVDGLSCSCCQLWVCHCLCFVSKLVPVWICLHTTASKGHKWLEGEIIYPPLCAPVHQEIQTFHMFLPWPLLSLNTHRGWISWDNAASKMLLGVKLQFRKWACFAVGHSKVVRAETVPYKWSVLFWRQLFTKEVEHCFY